MGFNTFPCNPYPISTEELNKGTNDDLNTRVSTLEGEVSDLNSTKANQITIAPFFSAEASYSVGNLVYYNGLTYRCTNDHEGEWDADDFAATTISNELDTLKSGLTNLENVVDVTNTMFSFNRDIGQNVYTADILLNNSNGVINVINDKKSGDTVVASMRLFLDVNNKSFKVGYYDGSNWQYETIKQFT